MPLPRRARVALSAAAAVAAAAAASPHGSAPTAFVTSVVGTGDLGGWPDAGLAVGLDAGDAICAARAAAGGLPDPGQFRAWLSTESVDAFCHVQGWPGERATNCGLPAPPETAGPWYRTDGHAFAPRLVAALGPAGGIRTAPAVDEFGATVADTTEVGIWTGTTEDGVAASGSVCLGWTSGSSASGLRGHVRVATSGFTQYFANGSCGNQARLLCLQQAAGAPFPPPKPGAIAFVTAATGGGDLSAWPGAGGYAGAAAGDRICRAAAASAGLEDPQSFRALLSDTARPARDRLAGDGPWRRLDGTLVAADRDDLMDGLVVGPVHQTETGAYLGAQRAFTGSTYFGTRAATRCSDWSSTEGDGTVGIANFTYRSWLSWQPAPCAEPAHLYCFADASLLFESGFEGGHLGEWSSAFPSPGDGSD